MAPPSGLPGPDPFDADLSAAREAVDDLGVGLAVWSYRREPDAAARRAGSGAVGEAVAALYRIRATLIGQIREADDRTAERVDQLLAAKTSEGPPGRDDGDGPPPTGDRLHTTQPPSRALAAGTRITRGADDGRTPHEEAP